MTAETLRQNYHARADELIERFRKTYHEKIDVALDCGALGESDLTDDYLIPKIVWSLTWNHAYDVPSSLRPTKANLAKFL